MKIDIIYPKVPKGAFQRQKLLNVARWPMLAAAAACIIVNLAVGGKPWCLVALMGLYMLWSLVLSPALIEYNRISQTIKLLSCSCILMGLIDFFLISGWALTVIPLVCLGGLATSGILFFTDLERQKQNMLPLLLLILGSLFASAAVLPLCKPSDRWVYIALGSLGVGLLIACIAVMGKGFFRELKKRFHTK